MKRKLILLLALCCALCFALFGLTACSGKDGITPTVEISADGYWVINGVKTEHKATADNATEQSSEIFTFVINEDNASYSVRGLGTISDRDIVIPATYKGKPVTAIAANTFAGCSYLTSIVIPDSVTSIGETAFGGCSLLTSIEIPDNVFSIGGWAFAACSSLEKIYCLAESKPDGWDNKWNANCDAEVVWGYGQDYTLEKLGQDYTEQLLAQSKINAGNMEGTFEIVVLNAEETVQNIQNYIFSDNISFETITGGLFVKFTTILNNQECEIFYNYALQFSNEQTANVAVIYDGGDTWYLEVVEQNKTILFEYSIL